MTPNPTNNDSPEELANLKAKRSLDKSEASVHEGEYTCAVCRPLIAELAAHKHSEVTGLLTPPQRRTMEQEFNQSIVIGDLRPLGFGEATDDGNEQGAVANASPEGESKLQQGSESTKLDQLVAHIMHETIAASISPRRTAELQQNFVADLLEWSRQEAAKTHAMYISDIAWAVGQLEGLGHPSEYLADRLKALQSSQEKTDE